MARIGWRGLPLPGFPQKPTTVGLVLSGGGSRASFHIGALDYLYTHDEDFHPTHFIGTSAGSILCAGLAQYGSSLGQQGFLANARRIWENAKEQSDMFTPRPWLRRLQNQAPTLLQMVTSPAKPLTKLPFLKVSGNAPERRSLVADPLTQALTPDEEPEPEWSLGLLAGLAGHLGKLPRLGSELAMIRQGFESTRSMYRPGPVLGQLLQTQVFDPARVEASGMQLRISMVALESGELRYMRGDGVIVDREDHPISDQRFYLSTGVLASCSIPAVFRPVPLGDETYVDGGARENVPAEMAIGHLGANRSYVVNSNPPGVARRQSMAEADILSVVTRSTEILIEESGRDEMAYAHSAGAVVIRPQLNVHDSMTVQPGLISINMDYGWSRAAQVVEEANADATAEIEEVFRLRMRAHRLEQTLRATPADVSTKLRLASAKRDLKGAVGKVSAALLPPGSETWWARWERHATPEPMEPFWV